MKTLTPYLPFVRWLLMLPVASVAGWNGGVFSATGLHADTYTITFVGAFTFVLVGAFVAPARRHAAIILSSIAFGVTGLNLFVFAGVIADGNTEYKLETLRHVLILITAVTTAYSLAACTERKRLHHL